MKLLLVVGLLAASALADKDVMLSENRVVAADVTQVGSTCDECQSLVKRFVDAAHDEAKMRELKMLLNVLCHETSYVDECRVFVANLDTLIKKLEPYLKDAKRVCKSFHMCSNNRLDAFRRIGMLYVKKHIDKVEGLKDLVCDECQMAAREVKKLVDDKEKQKEIRDFLSQEVCVHAGSYRGMCDMLVEQFLPEFFEELDVILQDTKRACADLGFCAGRSGRTKMEMLPSKSGEHPILEFWREAKTVKTSKGAEVLASCLDCKIEVDGFLALCEEDRNSIAADIQKLACQDILPKNFTPSCEDFMSMYLPTVLYMTFRQFSGEGYCTKHHHCDSASIAALNSISVYEQKTLAMQNCANIQSFIAQRVGTDARLRVNAVAAVQDTVCSVLPHTLHNLCYGFTEAIVPKGLNFFSRFAAEGKLCADRK